MDDESMDEDMEMGREQMPFDAINNEADFLTSSSSSIGTNCCRR